MEGELHPEQIRLADVFSSIFLFGPPRGKALNELVAHLFSPEEAAVAQHLPWYLPRSPKIVARRMKRPLPAVLPVLDAMADRRVIFRTQAGKFCLLPLLPGMFEYLLMTGEDSSWHRRYGQLINAMYATGYTKRYSTTPSPLIRNIPVETAIEHKSRVVDADVMSRMIDAHEHMAVLHVCQCRQSHAFEGHSCRRAGVEDGCLVFGTFAESAVQQGAGRPVSRDEMRGIVRERWKKNLVFMTANIEPSNSNAICTCCDCCCHFIESVNSFNGRVSLAEPHFTAQVDEEFCIDCGRCVKACNTRAHEIVAGRHTFSAAKCIGCGLCVDACPAKVISLRENPRYQRPSKSWLSFGLRTLPAGMLASLRAGLWKRQP